MGKSFEGRPIPLLTLTDPAVPLAEKSVAFFTGGTHGAEEVGRAATSGAGAVAALQRGAQHLRTQVVLICPCLSPDGAIRNSYHNAQDINIYTAYPLGGEPTTPEARAAYAVAQQWIPDCYADVHGLAGGAIGDSQYVPQGRNSGLFLMGLAISHEMDAAAEAHRLPAAVLSHYPVCQGQQHQDSLFLRLTAEDNCADVHGGDDGELLPAGGFDPLGAGAAVDAGEGGRSGGWYQPYRGYPCDLLAGSPVGALMTYGRRLPAASGQPAKDLAGDPGRGDLLGGPAGGGRGSRRDGSGAGGKRRSPTRRRGYVLQLRLDPRVRIKRVTFQRSRAQACRTDGYQVDGGRELPGGAGGCGGG